MECYYGLSSVSYHLMAVLEEYFRGRKSGRLSRHYRLVTLSDYHMLKEWS